MRKILFVLLFLLFSTPVYAEPDVFIQSPTNSTYSTTSIDLNWSANETVANAWYSLNGGENTSLFDEWQSDSAIVSGLGDIGGYSTPTIFQKDGIDYLIAGDTVGVFNGYEWDGSAWQSNATIVSGLGDVGISSSPIVFQKNSTWYLISGEREGIFNGFNWTGSAWQSDSAIVSGLGDIGATSSPIVFQKNSTWYLIAGEEDGVFNGFNWTGSAWQSDSAIVSGLGDVGEDSSPEVFQKDGNWYLVAGENDGVFNGFNWYNATWQSATPCFEGLGDIGSGSAPTYFLKDTICRLISGATDGKFYGFNKTFENKTINATEGSNNVTIYVENLNGTLGSSTQYFTVDTISPTITIHSPMNINYPTTSIDLNVSADEIIDTWYYSLNGGTNTTFSPNTTIIATEGANNVVVYANDTIGNLGSAIEYFTYDTLPPQNLVLNLPYDTDHTNDKQANFTWTVDYESGLTFDLIILNATDNSTVLNKTGITNQYYTLLLVEELEDADYYWYVIAYDLNNNSVNSASFFLVIDTVSPDITLFQYVKSDNSTVVGGSITLDTEFDDLYLFAVQANITNSTGGLRWNKTVVNLITDQYVLNDTLDMSSWASGTYTITLYAEDDHTASVIPDYDVTMVAVLNKLMFNTHSSLINIIYDKTKGTQEVVEDFTYEKLTDRYVFDYNFVDSGLEKTYRFKLQSNKVLYYRGDIYSYPSFVTGDNWVDFNLADDADYIVERQTDHLYYITVITDASTLRFQSLGGLNNVTEAYTFVVDNDVPVLSFVSPTPDNDTMVWIPNGTISVSSDESLLDNNVWLEISGGNETMTKINVTDYTYDYNLSDGNYTYKVYAYDLYGNLGVSETRTMTIDATTPPIFSIENPQNITYNAMTVPLDVTSSGREVSSWYFSVDYSAWDSFIPNTTLVGFEDNGVYRLDVLAIDILGLNTTETVYFSLNYTGFKYAKELTCIASGTHYVSVNPFEDDDMRWSCKLNTTEKFYCLTRVFGNDAGNVKDETKLIQTNPKRKVIERYGLVDYFESVGGVSNVYFTDERLIPDANYTYQVECYSLSGAQYGSYSDIVAVEYKQAANTMAMGVWGISNMGYLIGGFLMILIFLIILKLGLKK